jgi:hypothetical protein
VTGDPKLIEEYRRIHAERAYGNSSVKNLRFIRPEIQLLRPKSVLDYGCGQSKLIDQLELGYPAELHRYDPAIPDYGIKPSRPVDLLINIDVLEHIEEADLDDVIGEMRSLCRHAIIIIDTKPAVTLLADGRNAHVTLKPRTWWHQRLAKHFGHLEPIATVRRSRAGFKTWSRPPGTSWSYLRLRAAETARHLRRRAKR